MSGFFENLGATLGNGARNVVDKTKDVAGVASIKAQISTAQAGLGKLYKELGKAYFEEHSDSNEYEPLMEPIRDALKKITELEEKLADAQGTTKCPSCGAQVPKDSQFCPTCGVPIDIAKAAADAEDDSNKEIPIE